MTSSLVIARAWLGPVALAVGLAVASGCGGDDEPAVAPAVSAERTTTTSVAVAPSQATTTTALAGRLVEVQVVGGHPQGGIVRAAARLGERVVLRVRSDTTDDVHVHGYDLELPVGVDAPAELSFEATIPGVFEIELHAAGRQIAELKVTP